MTTRNQITALENQITALENQIEELYYKVNSTRNPDQKEFFNGQIEILYTEIDALKKGVWIL